MRDDRPRRVLETLLREAVSYLSSLLGQVRTIEADEEREWICAQWESRLDRDWPAHRYHYLIGVVATDLGRGELDPIRFYERHADEFREALRLADDDADLELEARRLVERALLAATVRVLPITGADVMQQFSLTPGPKIGRLLECALRLYDASPCGKETLLARMSDGCRENEDVRLAER